MKFKNTSNYSMRLFLIGVFLSLIACSDKEHSVTDKDQAKVLIEKNYAAPTSVVVRVSASDTMASSSVASAPTIVAAFADATSSTVSSKPYQMNDANASPKDGIFIGLHHSNKDWPVGCKHEGGTLIGENNFEGAVSQWTCHDKRFIVFDRMTHRDEKGIPHWEVVDFKVLPDLSKNENISDYADGCSNPSGGYTLAISKWEANKEKSFAYDISFAIRLNMDALKLEEIKPESVTCEYNEDRD